MGRAAHPLAVSGSESEELRRLRLEVKELRMEKEIPPEGAAYFVPDTVLSLFSGERDAVRFRSRRGVVQLEVVIERRLIRLGELVAMQLDVGRRATCSLLDTTCKSSGPIGAPKRHEGQVPIEEAFFDSAELRLVVLYVDVDVLQLAKLLAVAIDEHLVPPIADVPSGRVTLFGHPSASSSSTSAYRRASLASSATASVSGHPSLRRFGTRSPHALGLGRRQQSAAPEHPERLTGPIGQPQRLKRARATRQGTSVFSQGGSWRRPGGSRQRCEANRRAATVVA